MNAADSSPIVINADSEHSGVRLAVMVTFLVSFFFVFLILAAILRSLSGSLISDFYVAVSCVGALLVSIGAAGLSEYIAKRKWPSGRSVVIDNDGIVATVGPAEELHLTWAGHISIVKWYFHISGYRRGGRERRIPSGWYCISCQVQQDEFRFIVFTYMPEQQARQFKADNRFLELRPGDYFRSSMFRRWLTPPSRPEIPTKVLAGKQGHYWLAERRRWNEGMELDIEEFIVFMDVVNRRVKE